MQCHIQEITKSAINGARIPPSLAAVEQEPNPGSISNCKTITFTTRAFVGKKD